MTRIAIYGGSFNPVHNGHLIVAEELRQFFCLDQVIFVPAARPPHKPSHSLIDAGHRLAMLQLAIEGNPYFALSDVEIQRGGTSYTIDTLSGFRRQLGEGDRLYFIIGSDAFLELDSWKQAHELLDLACFIVIERPGACLKKALQFLQNFKPLPYQLLSAPLLPAAPLPAAEGSKVFFVQATLANISSSGIRDLVQRGKSLRYLVPDAVGDYIGEQGLYR